MSVQALCRWGFDVTVALVMMHISVVEQGPGFV